MFNRPSAEESLQVNGEVDLRTRKDAVDPIEFQILWNLFNECG
jgi:hypothetical protein